MGKDNNGITVKAAREEGLKMRKPKLEQYLPKLVELMGKYCRSRRHKENVIKVAKIIPAFKEAAEEYEEDLRTGNFDEEEETE